MFDWDNYSKNDDTGKLIVEPEYVPPPRHHFTVKFFLVLALATLILVCGLIAASLTGCEPVLPQQAQPTATHTTQDCTCDGTLTHAVSVNAVIGTPEDVWDVTTVHGHEKWYLNWTIAAGKQVVKPGEYILYSPPGTWSDTATEYQVSSINVAHKTMTAIALGN